MRPLLLSASLLRLAALALLAGAAANATVISQLQPQAGSLEVHGAVGSPLNFVFEATDTADLGEIGSWRNTALPKGLARVDLVPNSSCSLTGTPQTAGSVPVSVTVRDPAVVKQFSQVFTFVIGTQIIATQPAASSTIGEGGLAFLRVTGNLGDGESLSYQWYQGVSGTEDHLISGATASLYSAPASAGSQSYWVKVTRLVSGVPVVARSTTAAVTVVTPFGQWQAAVFTPAQLADSSISGVSADPDCDGFTNEDEYTYGTLPTVSDSALISLGFDGSHITFKFHAVAASGAGYENLERHYAVEFTHSLDAPEWAAFDYGGDIIAIGQQVDTYFAPPFGDRAFFRLRAWLAPQGTVGIGEAGF